MYYTLIPRKANFNRHQTEKTVDNRRGKLLFLLSISDTQIVLLYDDFWFYHVNVLTMNVIYEQKMEGKAYKAVVVAKNRIIVMEIERKRILSIDLENRTITQVYKIKTGSYINPRKLQTQFFLAKIQAFKDSNSFYLLQTILDERKLVFVYFPSMNKDSKTEHKFLIRQFEAKNFIYSQFDNVSSVVRYRQNPEQNGSFFYEEINLQSQEIVKHEIDFASFVSYSTVVEIKRLSEEKHLICLNSKNSCNEFIVYNKVQKSAQCIFTSQNILLKCISINEAENFGVFSFIYASTNYYENIKLISLANGKILDKIESRLDLISVSKFGDGFIDYSQQTGQKKQSEFVIYNIVKKRTNYLKMMENLKLNETFGEEFIGVVINMLQ